MQFFTREWYRRMLEWTPREVVALFEAYDSSFDNILSALHPSAELLRDQRLLHDGDLGPIEVNGGQIQLSVRACGEDGSVHSLTLVYDGLESMSWEHPSERSSWPLRELGEIAYNEVSVDEAGRVVHRMLLTCLTVLELRANSLRIE
jgi:hypothetical protein